jgi:hypothetical protein
MNRMFPFRGTNGSRDNGSKLFHDPRDALWDCDSKYKRVALSRFRWKFLNFMKLSRSSTIASATTSTDHESEDLSSRSSSHQLLLVSSTLALRRCCSKKVHFDPTESRIFTTISRHEMTAAEIHACWYTAVDRSNAKSTEFRLARMMVVENDYDREISADLFVSETLERGYNILKKVSQLRATTTMNATNITPSKLPELMLNDIYVQAAHEALVKWFWQVDNDEDPSTHDNSVLGLERHWLKQIDRDAQMYRRKIVSLYHLLLSKHVIERSQLLQQDMVLHKLARRAQALSLTHRLFSRLVADVLARQ